MEQAGNRVLKILFFLVWAIAIVNAAAEYWFWYWRVLWLDIPMHFVGGVWLGLGGLWLWRHTKILKRLQDRLHFSNVSIAFIFGLVVGLAWESYEYVVWRFSGKGFPMEYIADLQLDLVMDVLGAVVGAYLYTWLVRNNAPHSQ